jgi:hypothetical protein
MNTEKIKEKYHHYKLEKEDVLNISRVSYYY